MKKLLSLLLVLSVIFAMPISALNATTSEMRPTVHFNTLMQEFFAGSSSNSVIYNASGTNITAYILSQFANAAVSQNYDELFFYLSNIGATIETSAATPETFSLTASSTYQAVNKNYFQFLNRVVDGRTYNGLIDYNIVAGYTYNALGVIESATTPSRVVNEVFFEGAGDGEFVYSYVITNASRSINVTQVTFTYNFTLNVQYHFSTWYLDPVPFQLNNTFTEPA